MDKDTLYIAAAIATLWMLFRHKAPAATTPASTSTTPVSPTPTSATPAASSSSGDPATQQYQTDLNELGYGPIATDGILGPQTAAAINAFQSASGLPQTGQFDDATISAMQAALNNNAPTQTSVGPDYGSGDPMLSMSGE